MLCQMINQTSMTLKVFLRHLKRDVVCGEWNLDPHNVVSIGGLFFSEKMVNPSLGFSNLPCNRYPNIPLVALTATATPLVQQDVIQQLCLKNCVIFRSSFNRPNLRCRLTFLYILFNTFWLPAHVPVRSLE